PLETPQTCNLSHTTLFRSIDGRSEADTIRLWENYREQALMWRALALLQIPATFIALVFALWIWNTRSITLEVPAKPLPGRYLAKDRKSTRLNSSHVKMSYA